MKKALFLIFHGFDPNNGISKKISYQVDALKACGFEVHLCYLSETTTKIRMVDGTILANYGKGILSKIFKRIEFSSITNYTIKNNFDFVYVRSNHNANPFTIQMIRKMKRHNMKIIMEIPTFPYDCEYKAQGMSKQIFLDKLFRNCLAKQLDAIVTFSDYKTIFGQKTIQISNGIDFKNVRIKRSINDTSTELNLIGVAEIHEWHGFDRLIKGLSNYYSQHQNYKVKFHIVGYFFSPEGERRFKDIISKYMLNEYVFLYGKRHGEGLDLLFDKCDFGIGSLGRHRVGIYQIKTLKNREYAARGIPFIYSETDSDFDDKEYVLKAPADESPIDIHQIIRFYNNLKLSPREIRESIQNLSWESQMKHILNEIKIK